MSKDVRYAIRVSLDRWLTGDRFEMTTSRWDERTLIEDRDDALIATLQWRKRDSEATLVKVTRRVMLPNGPVPDGDAKP